MDFCRKQNQSTQLEINASSDTQGKALCGCFPEEIWSVMEAVHQNYPGVGRGMTARVPHLSVGVHMPNSLKESYDLQSPVQRLPRENSSIFLP